MKPSKLRPFDLAIYVCALTYTSMVWAGDLSFWKDSGIDWLSLVWAAWFGFLGGLSRTVYTLMSSKFVVLSVWRETIKDLIVAAGTGGAAYLIVEAAAAYDFITIPRQTRVMIILVAGFAPRLFSKSVERGANALVDNVVAKARGGAPEAPSSASVPLEPDTKP